jgi:hypothetical protein
MALPHQPDDAHPGYDVDFPPEPDESNPDNQGPPTLRLRVAIWDVICTLAMLTALVVLATTTSWPARLFGFANNVCMDDCGPVPYGVDQYIFPVLWGGIGAAVAAAVIGPFVSLVKGWYMSFWPVVALAIMMLSSVAGTALTAFSARYWG